MGFPQKPVFATGRQPVDKSDSSSSLPRQFVFSSVLIFLVKNISQLFYFVRTQFISLKIFPDVDVFYCFIKCINFVVKAPAERRNINRSRSISKYITTRPYNGSRVK